MPGNRSRPRIPLAKPWSKRVRSGVPHAISVAHLLLDVDRKLCCQLPQRSHPTLRFADSLEYLGEVLEKEGGFTVVSNGRGRAATPGRSSANGGLAAVRTLLEPELDWYQFVVTANLECGPGASVENGEPWLAVSCNRRILRGFG